MNHLLFRSYTLAVLALVAGAISASALAGGHAKPCQQCGCEKHVKIVCRLVKISEEADIPSYVYAKEDVFYPDKGSVCHTGYRSDTFYNFWRTCDSAKSGDASQRPAQHDFAELHCSAYTVCGHQTLYGAKSTGCHSHCSIRVPGKTQRITTPVLKWETVAICKGCFEKSGKKP